MVHARMESLETNGVVWDTTAMPEAEQFGAWQEVVCEAFAPVAVTRAEGGAFASTVASRRVGALSLSRIASPPQTVTRTECDVRNHTGDVYFLNMPLSEGTSATQDGRLAHLAPGDFTLVDSTRPFRLSFEHHFEQISLAIPHDALSPLLLAPHDVTAMRVRADRGAGALASGALRALVRSGGAFDKSMGRSLGNQLTSLIALALSEQRLPAPSGGRDALTREILAEAARSLGEHELSPAHVAARVGISTRYLHELMTANGESFGRWVLRRRLERCHEDLLEEELGDWTIAQIALRNGFKDASYFARAYRRAYDMTPKQRRAAGLPAYVR